MPPQLRSVQAALHVLLCTMRTEVVVNSIVGFSGAEPRECPFTSMTVCDLLS